MTCDTSTAVIRPIYFKCPIEVKRLYVKADDHSLDSFFETVNGELYLMIRVQPGEYTKTLEGERTRYKRGFKTKRVEIKLRSPGFTLELPVDDIRLRYIFEHLAEVTQSSGLAGAQTPITVLDFVEPGRKAYAEALAASTDPYKIRYGLLDVEAQSGFSGRGTNLAGEKGFRVVFEDLEDVLV